MAPRVLIAAWCVFIVAGCTSRGPAEWGDRLASQVRCDQSIAQVRALTVWPVQETSVAGSWYTHTVRDNKGTELRLAFAEGKLKFSQLTWVHADERRARFQRVGLCGPP